MTLRDLTVALDAVSDQAFCNDRPNYLGAVEYARSVGASEEQIRDAYGYAAHQRLTMTDLPPVGFDVEGNLR